MSITDFILECLESANGNWVDLDDIYRYVEKMYEGPIADDWKHSVRGILGNLKMKGVVEHDSRTHSYRLP